METALEQILTSTYKEGMMNYMKATPSAFDELIQLALSDQQPYAWRAAWLLSHCAKTKDQRVQPFVAPMIDRLAIAPDGQKRDLINVLRKMEIDEDDIGKLFDVCIDIWVRTTAIPSVRINAFRLLLKICAVYPDLYNEVSLLTETEYLDSLSLGIRKTVYKLIRDYEVEYGVE